MCQSNLDCLNNFSLETKIAPVRFGRGNLFLKPSFSVLLSIDSLILCIHCKQSRQLPIEKTETLSLNYFLKILFTVALSLTFSTMLYAQSEQDRSLAFEYYQNGEFQKAAELFEDLLKDDKTSTVYYNYLYNSLLQTKEFSDLEKLVKSQMKDFPGRYGYIVDLGNAYEKDGELKKAEKTFEKAIDDLEADNNQVLQIANAFTKYGKWNYTVKAFERGRELFRGGQVFNLELAAAHENNGESIKAIPYYLQYLKYRPDELELVESKLLPQLESDEYAELLKKELLGNIQKSNSSVVFNELLIWYYSQFGNFKAAFIQARALDKRQNENGSRLLKLAKSARDQEDYDAAIDCYSYVMEKGPSTRYYLMSRQELLETQREKITSGNYTSEDLQELDASYDAFLDEFGLNRNTAKTLRQKAQLHAYYMDDYQTAIQLLEDLIESPQVDKKLVAECKLDLGDFYLMNEEIWEATLLYSQVDKSMKDEPLGELARFKNAQLSYYTGDFDWAQTQLSVLKGATSELISNNAIDLSVFIMDNMGLDTTAHPMELFARAELLNYQKKYDKALSMLDSITYFYPEHSLKDDILFEKAQIAGDRRNYESAKTYYEQLVELSDPENLLLDNALFNLADIYENELNQPDKAMELYQQIILDFRESIFVVEARKRFRKLRGDQL